jgi:hypothetical protein
MKPQNFLVVLGFGVAATVILCFVEISRGNLNAKESLLFSFLLTIATMIGSGIITKYYADYSANDNLRFFALKAAEKVTNLSNELSRLALYLQDELETTKTDYGTPNEALLAKELKIEFAIQMINTLKSVNDKSLSDWQGVIGEEINARAEEQEEAEEHLRDLITRLELVHSEIENTTTKGGMADHDNLVGELDVIKREVRGLAAQVSGVPFKRAMSAKPKKQSIEKSCPKCSQILKYNQRPSIKGMKGMTCPACGTKLVSSFRDGQFSLEVNRPLEESIDCTFCHFPFKVLLDPVPGGTVVESCPACKAHLLITRAAKEIRIRSAGASSKETAKIIVLSEEFLQQVKSAMPVQPWPKGAAKTAAAQLGVTQDAVDKAIRELIRRREFKLQFDGELFDPIPTSVNPAISQ